jgi:hypothetical protein
MNACDSGSERKANFFTALIKERFTLGFNPICLTIFPKRQNDRLGIVEPSGCEETVDTT